MRERAQRGDGISGSWHFPVFSAMISAVWAFLGSYPARFDEYCLDPEDFKGESKDSIHVTTLHPQLAALEE